jgi:hypothetical protein
VVEVEAGGVELVVLVELVVDVIRVVVGTDTEVDVVDVVDEVVLDELVELDVLLLLGGVEPLIAPT